MNSITYCLTFCNLADIFPYQKQERRKQLKEVCKKRSIRTSLLSMNAV